MAELTITSAPVSASLTCDSCGAEITFPFAIFYERYGTPYGMHLGQSGVTCPACGYQNGIDSINFD